MSEQEVVATTPDPRRRPPSRDGRSKIEPTRMDTDLISALKKERTVRIILACDIGDYSDVEGKLLYVDKYAIKLMVVVDGENLAPVWISKAVIAITEIKPS